MVRVERRGVIGGSVQEERENRGSLLEVRCQPLLEEESLNEEIFQDSGY